MCISLCITSVDKQNNIIRNQMFAFILLFLQGRHFLVRPPLKPFANLIKTQSPGRSSVRACSRQFFATLIFSWVNFG